MSIGRSRFNIYLICLLVAVVAGCRSPEQKKAKQKEKQLSKLAVHLEVPPDSIEFSRTIQVFREKPIMVTVDKSPFLTEAQVTDAKIIPQRDGWALSLKFDKRGTWLLEQYTTTNPGKHMAIFGMFGGEKQEARWLGAPVILHRISSGILTFTPDSTREEAEELVLGLNNLAKQVAEKDKW